MTGKVRKKVSSVSMAMLLFGLMGIWGCSGQRDRVEELQEMNSEKTVLEVYAWPDEKDNVKLLADAYMVQHPDVTIHTNIVPISEYSQRMLNQKNSAEEMDCIFCPNTAEANIWLNKGLLKSLEAWNTQDLEEYYNDWYLEGEEICGSYMLPYRMSRWAVYYNKDLFDAAGIPYPSDDWTWDDYEQIAVKLSGERDGILYYGSLSFEPTSTWWRVPARTMGANDPMKEEDLAAFEKSAEWIYNLTYEKKAQIPYEKQTGSNGSNYDATFLRGNIGMYFSGDWSATILNEARANGEMGFEYDIAPLPHVEGEERWVLSDAAVITMVEGTEHPEETWDFMKFVAGEEGAKILAENNVIPAWNTKEVREIYLASSDTPEHREKFFIEGKISSVPSGVHYTESLEIVREEVSLYLLQEQTREQAFDHIRRELKEIK